MKDNFLDDITTGLREAMASLELDTRAMFKGVKPYRTKAKSKKEAFNDYMSTDPSVHEAMRQQYPDYEDYEKKVLGGYDA